LQGPHHGAQKSTSTGTSIEGSITSRSNEDKVASIIVFPIRLWIDGGAKTKFNAHGRDAALAKPGGDGAPIAA
jgi:hypothetical protein